MARLNERHYGIDAAAILESVLTQLPAGIDAFKAFLDFDAKTTTKPAAIKNPGGYYRDLVPKFRERNLTASQIDYRNFQRELEAKEPEPAPSCPLGLCSGNGERFSESGSISACECEAGRRKTPKELKFFEDFNAAIARQGVA
jgi:hypothetical protein